MFVLGCLNDRKVNILTPALLAFYPNIVELHGHFYGGFEKYFLGWLQRYLTRGLILTFR